MTEVRNMIHGGGQAGVPSNLRAVAKNYPKFATKDDKLREALRVINTNKDRTFSLEYFGQNLGYARHSGGGNKLMNELTRGGYVRVEDAGFGQLRYYLTATGYRYLQAVPTTEKPQNEPSRKERLGVAPAPGLPREPGRQRRISKNTIQRYRSILQYVQEHEGEHTTQEVINASVGYSIASGAPSAAIGKLVQMGLLIKEGHTFARYYITDAGRKWLSSLARGDERNGEVVVSAAPTPVPEPESTPKPVQEPLPEPEEKEITPSTKIAVQATETLVLTVFDQLAWDFLKQYRHSPETTGRAVLVLRDFREWLSTQQTDKE